MSSEKKQLNPDRGDLELLLLASYDPFQFCEGCLFLIQKSKNQDRSIRIGLPRRTCPAVSFQELHLVLYRRVSDLAHRRSIHSRTGPPEAAVSPLATKVLIQVGEAKRKGLCTKSHGTRSCDIRSTFSITDSHKIALETLNRQKEKWFWSEEKRPSHLWNVSETCRENCEKTTRSFLVDSRFD